MIDIKHCAGCRDDFYNHRTNCDGKSRCWSAESGEMVKRLAIPRDVPPPYKGYKPELRPDCYVRTGTVYVDPKRITKDGYWA
jgi:hypothetical protein